MALDPSAIANALKAMLDAGTPTYLLVDPMLGEPIGIEPSGEELAALQAAREAAWQRDVHVVALPAQIDLPPSLHPYLVALQGAGDPWLVASVEIAVSECEQAWAAGLEGTGMAPYRLGGWLNSSLHPSDVAQHLATLMVVRAQVPTSVRYVRLADRRVMEWLGVVVGQEAWSAALGRISSWAYLDALGRPRASVSAFEVPTLPRLDRDQWQLFMEGAVIHPTLARLIGQWRQASIADWPADNLPALYRATHTAVGFARRAARQWPARFTGPHDLTAWAALSLLHADVLQHHEVIQCIQRSPEHGEPTETVHALCALLDQICRRSLLATSDSTRT